MDTALKSWELENTITLVDPHRDALYKYDDEQQISIGKAALWKTDPNYFKNVRISAVALLKMVMHARFGGSIEVMGLMQGFTNGDTIVVTDAFRLPVEGTETRVNAQSEGYEYMVQYLSQSRLVGQGENAVGWYHSHPGYGCWLSGIDVQTQALQQSSDPFVAIVIDPERTVLAGRVEIGAFRTYPESYKPEADTTSDGFQTIPLAKIEDFGAHSSRYYSLEVTHFKSTLDSQLLAALWNKYWVATLSQSPLLTNRDYGTKQIQDLAHRTLQAEDKASGRTPVWGGSGRGVPARDVQLEKVVRAGKKIATEEKTGLLAADIKIKIFNIPERGVVGDEDTEMKA